MYIEVIVPLPLQGTFTYSVPEDMREGLTRGCRVVVPFGRKKFYTGIVERTDAKPPVGFEAKDIAMVLDRSPIVRRPQLELWQWVADYYLSTPGDVYKAAIPAGLKIESESYIEAVPDILPEALSSLKEREALVLQALDHDGAQRVSDLERLTGLKGLTGTLASMMGRGVVAISEKLVERYRPKRIRMVAPAFDRDNREALRQSFESVGRAKMQERALLALIELTTHQSDMPDGVGIPQQRLCERAEVTAPIITAMERKGLLRTYVREVNRFSPIGMGTEALPPLTEAQQQALKEIHIGWQSHQVMLLHGVTASGKTEIYMHLADYVLQSGKRVLYLVPEIALTTQLTSRLQRVFGEKVVIYHSKFSDNERVDIWRRLLDSNDPVIVIGARSAVFLPLGHVGLVIVDEEHESGYKQTDPSPRYNARDTALVLARMHGAKALLGSATPAVDTYYKALEGKYGLVTLDKRYGDMPLPRIDIVDLTLERKRKTLHGSLSEQSLTLARGAIESGHQAIFFINRRGYAPVAMCRQCAWTPKCEKCDVSLTYHKSIDRLVCHYCGTTYPLPTICPACKEPTVDTLGYGTERVEDEIAQAFPDREIIRMDLDSTRGKESHARLIEDFSQGKAPILVGTQMVTKGLDFGGVTAVTAVNADAMLHMPDFRATERTFDMLEQVAGRAGRKDAEGCVVIQTRQPDNPIFRYITDHDYRAFYDHEIAERREYLYPPFTRIIYVTLRHRDKASVDLLADHMGQRLRSLIGNRVFGPDVPPVGRIQSMYLSRLMLKVETTASMSKVKEILRGVYEELHAIFPAQMKGASVAYDVDPL